MLTSQPCTAVLMDVGPPSPGILALRDLRAPPVKIYLSIRDVVKVRGDYLEAKREETTRKSNMADSHY